ncbi:terminase large subunit [Erythrobacter litoralis]|uniref:terminase large subunit n=1 Tax=Erythrobacter litoralis TaxID=39960 RepID=UPI0024351C29|nr:terminase TerL endonuclease subunit [Erythrobacter litoralis]MDG6079762.1 terminase large subunit [Erythrobacter litoralis]
MSDRDYAAIAKQYARDVVSGKQPAGKSIRLQAARFLAELKQARSKEFPYRFDPDKAVRPCKFIERLPHSKGKWAAKKETLRLEPWQVWTIVCTFGWVHKDGDRKGLRRFRVLFVVVPRKNGKSAIAAGVGLYMFTADGEFGAEVYSGATNEKQAWEVFGPARLMAQRTPALLKRFGVEVNARNLMRVADNSKFETLIGDPGDGQSPSCSIHDEYHEHPDDGQVDTMQTGMGARDQPLQVLITTAGDNLAGPCYAAIQEEREKLAGIGHNGGPPLEDETFFAEWTIDEDDDWKSEAALRKANPNMGISVSADFLLSRQRDAINTPRKRGVFKTKHLNLWVAAKAAYFDVEAWRRCSDPDLPQVANHLIQLEHLRGRRCVAGLDLASKIDIAALELLFPPIGAKATPEDPYIRAGWYFVPEKRVLDVPAYEGWDGAGMMSVTNGEIIDYDEVLEKLREIRGLFQLEQISYDPHQATYLATTAMKDGFPMLEYRQIVLNMSEPMKELDALMRAGTIAHGGCPVMEWQINNVLGAPDKKDNVYPNKPRDEAKIDNPVALMMALGTAMNQDEEEAGMDDFLSAMRARHVETQD